MDLIKTNEQLIEICESISKEKFITIDTEFIREKTYWSKLCLIQICTHDKEIIIDPLENNIDLKPFIKILCNYLQWSAVTRQVRTSTTSARPDTSRERSARGNLFARPRERAKLVGASGM